MSHRAIRRILQSAAMVAALAVSGLAATDVAAQVPADDPARQQQPIQDRTIDPEPEQERFQTSDMNDDEGSSWGWLGLLGLAGLMGLRRRDRDDRSDVRPATHTTTRQRV